MNFKTGFSLVELSIVLVILGLLTGGILAGQSLIRASELRSVGSDFQRFSAAMNTFRDKYFSLPGDMRNATSFWGDQAAGTASCADGAIANGTPGTCNGNGDGGIEYVLEGYRGWQQLALAGLIEGSYQGYSNTTADYLTSSVPRSKIGNGGYMILYESRGQYGWTGADIATNYNALRLGTVIAGPPVRIGDVLLKPEETWNIDTKLDDGKPGTGRVYTYLSVNSCHSNTIDTSTATYNLSNSSVSCMPQYIF